ncbi:MAG: hypothetical protein QNJ49_12680 [Mastigocoleus sp. MO_167.B18]|nr:hypothetical protein [Mastigocoleus sp. MO_167.B18]
MTNSNKGNNKNQNHNHPNKPIFPSQSGEYKEPGKEPKDKRDW